MDFNDKNLVIGALLIISLVLCFVDVTPESINVINNIISGLLGLAVGKFTETKRG